MLHWTTILLFYYIKITLGGFLLYFLPFGRALEIPARATTTSTSATRPFELGIIIVSVLLQLLERVLLPPLSPTAAAAAWVALYPVQVKD